MFMMIKHCLQHTYKDQLVGRAERGLVAPILYAGALKMVIELNVV